MNRRQEKCGLNRCRGLSLVTLVVLLLLAGSAAAAELTLIPSLAVREEYNDNLFFSESDEEQDWVTTLTPALELVRNTERLKLNTVGYLGFRKYLDHDSLDAIDQQYRGTAEWGYSPRLAVSGEAGYLRDFRTDRDLEETGLVTSRTRRDRQRYGLGLEYALTERSMVNLGWVFTRMTYADDEEADSDSHSGSLGWSCALTERLRNLVNLGYSHSEFVGSRLDYLVLQTGLGYAGTERLTWQALAGARYTRSRFEELVPFGNFSPPVFQKQEAEAKDWGWVASANVTWQGELSQASLSLQREVRLASGRTGSTEITSLVVNGQRRLSEQFSLAFNGGYYINRADEGEFGGEDIDERTLRLSPGLRYRWTPDLMAELNYDFTRLDDRKEDTEASRNLIFLRLTYRFPMEF